jgi:hypothetical protein
MKNKDNIRPIFQKVPKFILVTIAIVSLPYFFCLGFYSGGKEAAKCWLNELVEVWNL